MNNRLFQLVFLVNSYTRSVIIKHVKQINRLLSAPYDRQRYDQEPIGYYNWYQLSNDANQLARHGYFDQLQSTLLSLEQKYENYKWFDDNNTNGDDDGTNDQDKRKWIPNLKEIIESLTRYPQIIKSHGDILNYKQHQDDDDDSISVIRHIIQDFIYTRYGLDNLEEFTKSLIGCSFKNSGGDLEMIKWVESIHNDNILNVMDKYKMDILMIYQTNNQDILYHCFKIFQSSNHNSSMSNAIQRNHFIVRLGNHIKDRDKECTTLINHIFDNMSEISESIKVAMILKCIKTNHPRVIEIIQSYQSLLFTLLQNERLINDVCLSPGALPIISSHYKVFPKLYI
ncbi:hypothetical protein DFA_00112 [Cavenderia fasciculata]|uniref:Uncharacterized protein n=1 Tax=Cavenderia fasciculata TaxID=261658 RepID=F4PXM4_CACFS|nr:uncharacterized protein DFA_00112 [Cavenderia fasciculata]EGG19534.1 hypothetical protein DFA_00112 [Cavenderia fasciculata]|eukprot:XP_004357828.1 hypothetical protein DFA_00112 [Cavenderia fasciculata]